ncbi:MAG TPA: fibronectin type III domain-containing protein [Candidatus Acidoferrum sp.]|nr:fibronectin type III domain-containing protein [Candidatus Acidoferrum sp.]
MTSQGKRMCIALTFLLCLFSLNVFAPPANAQANLQGQWQNLVTLAPINPVHMALMHNGKVLIVTGSGNDKTVHYFQGGVWDPQSDTFTTQPVTWDMFCNGMVILPDGRPFILGGTLQYTPAFLGLSKTAAYDPASGSFVDLQSMAHGRWYPTGTVLGDGRVIVFSGLTETGSTNTAVEIYKVGSGWSAQFNAPFTPPLYPRMHLLPNGKVFFSGSTTQSWTFDPSNQSWAPGPSTIYGNTRTYGTSVLLPLMPAKGYAPKVMIMGGDSPSTSTTELIDLSVSNPKWVSGPSMVQPRIEMNATILPDGRILTSGGSQIDEDGTTASLKAELYDPKVGTTGGFVSAGSNFYPRLYHSNSLLLPDATVLLAGSNPHQGTYDPHMELYSPPYLFNANGGLAARPTIAGVTPGVIGYGNTFQIQTPDAANISSVVLIRAGAVTHSFDMDQRLVGLNFTTGAGTLNATAPPNGNIAPPGYYLLFILNSSGVPSVAQFVQLSITPTDQPPTGTITSPSGDVVIAPGQSVTFASSASDPDGSVASFSWAFPGGSPSSSSAANPGAVRYSTAGTYFASLTVTDNLGLTDPSPAIRTVTVTPDFSLSFTPSAQSVAPGNSTSFTVTVTSGTGFSGSVAFSVTGLPAGAAAAFNPATVTTSGSTTLTITTAASAPTGNFPLTVTGTSGSTSHSVIPALVVFASADTQPPSAPGNLAASSISNSQINLTWTASTDNIGVTGYSVERCQGSGCSNFSQVATLTTATTFSDTALQSSTAYTYRVRASDASGNFSPYSNLASATTPAPPPASVVLVQQVATKVAAGTNTLSQSFVGPSNTGDLLVVALKWGDQNISVASVTDSRNNTYTSAVGPTNWSGTAKRAQIFYAKNIIGTGAPITITATLTGSSTSSFYIYQLEYANADINAPLDATAAAIGTATSVSSGPATISFANELVFGFSIADSVGINPGPGFTAESTFQGNLVEDRSVTTPGSYAATGTATGVSNWFMQMATFKPGSADTVPPSAPSNLTALATSPVQINLSWTGSTDKVGVTGYDVRRCTGSGCTNFGTVTSLPATATSYNDTALASSTAYTYQIVATDAAGNTSLPSNPASAITLADTIAPSAPSNLIANSFSSTRIDLSWTGSTDNVGVTSYGVQRCTGSTCTNFAPVTSVGGTTTSYSDTSVVASTTYSYQIVATDAANNPSLPSNTATATTPGLPAAPSGLTATASSPSQIDMSWTNNAINQTGFKVERSPDGSTFTQIGTSSASSTTYSDPNRTPLTTYFYRVRATNAAGDSGYSNVASATTLADTTPPSTPTNLTATAASSTQINLSWTPATDNIGVTSYIVQRCQGSGCSTFSQVGTSASPSFSDSALLASTSYSYQVRALDAANNPSGFSNVATATTQAAAPPPPVTLVQHIETSVLSGTNTISQSFPAISVSGDLIIVSLKWGDPTVSVSSVVDSHGNAYTSAVGPTDWNGTTKRGQIFYAKNIVGGGTRITITATLTANSTSSFHLYQFEYANTDPTTPVDATAASAGSGISLSCGPVTTNFANDLLFAVAFNDSTVTSAGPGFTTESNYHSNVVEDMQTGTAGSYIASATNNSTSYWYMQLLAIKRHP